MAKRRKKKVQRPIHPSLGPLPERLAAEFAGRILVFSDASLKRQGGLAVVIFASPESEPLVLTRSVPPAGSNELELLAAALAVHQVAELFPGQPWVLFSDNHDAVCRLRQWQSGDLSADPPFASGVVVELLRSGDACIRWIKAHSTCRGNWLADQHAALAAA